MSAPVMNFAAPADPAATTAASTPTTIAKRQLLNIRCSSLGEMARER